MTKNTSRLNRYIQPLLHFESEHDYRDLYNIVITLMKYNIF